MSFITKIGDNSGSSQKLALMRKKYFRNISEFNQVWLQEKKQQQMNARAESHRRFNSIISKQQQAIEIEKEHKWNRKLNNQQILKDDYEKQMTERVVKHRQEKQIDKQYAMLQNLENDKFMERRMLDFMKIYDRRAVNNSTHRRIRTEVDGYDNPEAMSHQQTLTRKQYLQPLEGQARTNPLRVQSQQHTNPQGNNRPRKQVNEQLQQIKQQFDNLRHKVPLLPPLEKQKRTHRFEVNPMPNMKGSRSTKVLMTNNVIF